MTDKYIDHDEIQYYGPWAAKRIRDHVKGLISEFDPGLEYAATEIEHATSSVVNLIESSRAQTLTIMKSAEEKAPVMTQSFALLNRFSSHLDAHPKGTVQRRAFFPTDGTITGVGRSAARVVLALSQISTELNKPDCQVKDAAVWQKQIEDQFKVLSPIADHAYGAAADKTNTTAEVEASRQAWLHIYKSAKKIVDGVLTMAGKRSVLKTVFWEMSVPAGTKLTHDPAGTVELPPK